MGLELEKVWVQQGCISTSQLLATSGTKEELVGDLQELQTFRTNQLSLALCATRVERLRTSKGRGNCLLEIVLDCIVLGQCSLATLNDHVSR